MLEYYPEAGRAYQSELVNATLQMGERLMQHTPVEMEMHKDYWCRLYEDADQDEDLEAAQDRIDEMMRLHLPGDAQEPREG